MSTVDRDCTRGLQTSASSYSLSLSVELDQNARAWASALVRRARLTFAVVGDDDARLDEWLAALPEIELPLSRHFVADAEVIERSANAATIELLLVEG